MMKKVTDNDNEVTEKSDENEDKADAGTHADTDAKHGKALVCSFVGKDVEKALSLDFKQVPGMMRSGEAPVVLHDRKRAAAKECSMCGCGHQVGLARSFNASQAKKHNCMGNLLTGSM